MVIELKALEAIEDLIDLIKQDAAPASQDKWYYVRNHPAPLALLRFKVLVKLGVGILLWHGRQDWMTTRLTNT